MIRECGEEASLPAVYVQKNLSSTGLISYVRKDKDNWLFPEIEYTVSAYLFLWGSLLTS